MTQSVFWGAAGLLTGILAACVVLLPKLRAGRQAARILQARLDEAGVAQVTLTELRVHLQGLRHDIRGILSPALLVADRLVSHAEPGVRRAGDVMIWTVERAVDRLSETRLDQTYPESVNP